MFISYKNSAAIRFVAQLLSILLLSSVCYAEDVPHSIKSKVEQLIDIDVAGTEGSHKAEEFEFHVRAGSVVAREVMSQVDSVKLWELTYSDVSIPELRWERGAYGLGTLIVFVPEDSTGVLKVYASLNDHPTKEVRVEPVTYADILSEQDPKVVGLSLDSAIELSEALGLFDSFSWTGPVGSFEAVLGGFECNEIDGELTWFFRSDAIVGECEQKYARFYGAIDATTGNKIYWSASTPCIEGAYIRQSLTRKGKESQER